MASGDLDERFKRFSVRIIRLVGALPKGRVGDVLGRQVLRSGTSMGANYREARHASSKRHFITTLEIAQREANETVYWLELISESDLVKPARMTPLVSECHELISILTAAVKTAKRRQ